MGRDLIANYILHHIKYKRRYPNLKPLYIIYPVGGPRTSEGKTDDNKRMNLTVGENRLSSSIHYEKKFTKLMSFGIN